MAKKESILKKTRGIFQDDPSDPDDYYLGKYWGNDRGDREWSFDRIRDWVSREDSDLDPNALSPFGYMGPKEDKSEYKFGKRFSDWRDRNKARRADRQARRRRKEGPLGAGHIADRTSSVSMLAPLHEAAGPQADRGLAEAEQNIREAKAAHRRVTYNKGGQMKKVKYAEGGLSLLNDDRERYGVGGILTKIAKVLMKPKASPKGSSTSQLIENKQKRFKRSTERFI